MARLFAHLRLIAGALALAFLVALSAPVVTTGVEVLRRLHGMLGRAGQEP